MNEITVEELVKVIKGLAETNQKLAEELQKYKTMFNQLKNMVEDK